MLTLVAVSGTIEEGFGLRKNIDSDDFEAIFVGHALCRGAKMYFDVKQTVNPAIILTGDEKDANVYSVYVVDERACLAALLGEPRLLSMCPDGLRIDLNDPLTSPKVTSLARRKLKQEIATCAVLSVVAVYKSCRFVEAPPFETRDDGTRITSFRRSLALFAGTTASPGTSEWDCAVRLAMNSADPPANFEQLYSNDTRLSTLFPSEELAQLLT